jgi:hypothetical protein
MVMAESKVFSKSQNQAPLTPDDTNRSEIAQPMQKGSFEEGKIS